MRSIELTTPGVYALVDDDDYDRLSQHNWYLHQGGYAQSRIAGKTIGMHRLVCQPSPGLDTDHKNRDKLDNRRANLRECTRSQNHANQKKRRGSSSRFKGVYWNKHARKWQAEIKANGKYRYLGLFTDEKDAALAYDEAAREGFGEFARGNFIQATTEDDRR